MSNVFESLQLQRIANYIDAGKAGGGTLTMDVTGFGDMQGATAGQAGVHGLVPAPAAGDQDKYLSGGGTWEDPPASGGVDYSTSEQDTGLKWIDGRAIYQITEQFTTPTNDSYESHIISGTSNVDMVISLEAIIINGTMNGVIGPYPYTRYNTVGGYYYAGVNAGVVSIEGRVGSEIRGGELYVTVRYVKTP